ncbi:MAG: hypothetical protein A2V84_01580 [Chloroflexi bacterium RBG_16_70_13]|nr:MAG: hypothetical protein A2V84_01580 [Chloroflexi bacterium RBG_16_70_13]
MTPTEPASFPHASRPTRSRSGIVIALLALAIGGCVPTAATFDPSGPCVTDGQTPGAYPDLEGRLPAAFDGTAPTTVDSGRTCTADGLGSLVDHDVEVLTYAGATWDLGNRTGVTSVVFAVPEGSLPAAWMAEFYEAGARAGKKTSNVETSRPAFEGTGDAWRLDALNDLSFQSVVTWQDGGIVRVVLVATPVEPGASVDAHDELVAAAVRATVEVMAAGR